MSVTELFSKRLKRQQGNVPDVYKYNDVPSHVRVQIIHIINDAIGSGSPAAALFETIHRKLCREYGVYTLCDIKGHPREDIKKALETLGPYEKVLDIIEISFQHINTVARKHIERFKENRLLTPDQAIEELNHRFRESGIGYAFEGNQLIRIDSKMLHTEVIKPALCLLQDTQFQGADDEFSAAHEHYRHGRYKESLTEALKAFESTMKTICQIRGWRFNPTDSVKLLIDVCIKQGLFPKYTQTQLDNLRVLLESGLPTLRNKSTAAHGQGATVIEVPAELASYGLHITGANIVLLVEAFHNLS